MRLTNVKRFAVFVVVCILTVIAVVNAAKVDSKAQTVIEVEVTEVVMAPTPEPVVEVSAPIVRVDVVEVVSRSAEEDRNTYLLAKLIHCEAGIDTMAGKLAVGTIVMNRVSHYNTRLFGGPTVEGVIMKKLPNSNYHQFSCVDDAKLWAEEPDEEALEAARKVLGGYRSFRESFLYYYNPTKCEGIKGIVCDYRVGMHVFGEGATKGVDK